MKGNPEVDKHISNFPEETQKVLEKVRATIKKAAPKAEETMSYGIPTFKLNGNLVHFAGYKNHVGFYPAPSAIEEFKKEISVYKSAKGSVQFPLDKPMPLALITKMVKFRVAENTATGKSKAAKKKPSAKPKTAVKAVDKKDQQLTDQQQVSSHIKKLAPMVGKVVSALRKIILSADDRIGERIKWNNPSFYYTGAMKESDPKEHKRELIVFNLFKNRIMLVFPSGAKVKDTTGFLEGDYKDGRRLTIFKDLKDVEARKTELQKVIQTWIGLIDK